jgi:predicted nucleic acid-binding protein
MNALLLDTNVVSILFNRKHRLRQTCIDAVAGHQLVISFMSRAELLLWPEANNWGAARRSALEQHMALYLTLYPDERACALWSQVVDQCRRAGQRIQAADAWIASAAVQWSCPLVTTDFKDYAAIDDMDVVPIR